MFLDDDGLWNIFSIFDPSAEDRRHLGNAKQKLRIFFGIALSLHYICRKLY